MLIVGGSGLCGAAGFQETTLNATIFALFLFSIRMPVRGMAHTLFLKVGWIRWNTGDGKNRNSGSLEGFQRVIRLSDGFLGGATRITKARRKRRKRHMPSLQRRQTCIEDG